MGLLLQILLALALAACGVAPEPVPPPPGPSLEALRREAEEARGLRFQGAVDARFLPPAGLAAALREEIDLALDPELARRDAAVKEAVGLLPPGTDLRAALLAFQGVAVAGFYTPLRRRLYVVETAPGAALSRDATLTAVHELVHALQHEHFALLEALLGLTEHDDLAFALGALLEGDATWASYRYEERRRGLPPPDASDFARDYGVDWAADTYPQAPRLLREGFLLQYPAGYAFASRLVEGGGLAALDAALRDPPLSSEELLHPDRLHDPRGPGPLVELPVEAWLRAQGPASPGRVIAGNRFGEIGLRIWARERGADPAASRRLAAGWDADRAVLLEGPRGRVMAWLIQLDDAGAAARLEAGMARLAAGLAQERGLAGPERVERSGRRVLLSAGLPAALRRGLLEELPEQVHEGLEDFLRAHPEVAERTRELRERAARRR